MIGLSDIPSSTEINKVVLTNVTNSFDLGNNESGTSFSIRPQVGNITLSPGGSASTSGVRTVYAAIPATEASQRQLILETSTTNFTTPFTSAKLSNGYAYNTIVWSILTLTKMANSRWLR